MDIHSGAAIGREELLGQAGGGAPATGGVSGGMIVAGAGLIASYAASQPLTLLPELGRRHLALHSVKAA
jgi:hypothetical protein